MNFKKAFFKSVVISGGYNYTSQALTFFSTIITARLLEPHIFGFVGLITIFTGFISIFADSGISLAIIRSVYRYTFYKAVDSLALVIGVTLFLTTCVLAYPLSLFYKQSDLIIPIISMAIIFVPKSMAIVRSAILSKALQFHILGRITLIGNILQITLTIVMAYKNYGYWSLIIPQIISSCVMLILFEKATHLGFKVNSIIHIKVAYNHLRKTIGNLMGFNIINYWARNSDNLIVGKYYGTNDLGIYNRAYSLLTIPLTLITGLIGNVLYPNLRKLEILGGDINREYFFVLKLISFLCYPVTITLVLFNKELVILLWGAKWIEVSSLLPYFGILILNQALLSTTGNILVLKSKEKVLMISGWVGALVMIGAICLGAMYSMLTIAQFYSLAFIIVVMPFNLIYVFVKGLQFKVNKIVIFIFPIIILSSALWVSCYFNLIIIKHLLLLILLLFIVVSSKKELASLIQSFINKVQNVTLYKIYNRNI